MTTIKRLLNFGRKPSKPLLADEDIAMNGTLRETLEAEVRAKARAEAEVKAQIADLEAQLKSNVAKCGTKAEKVALEQAFAAVKDELVAEAASRVRFMKAFKAELREISSETTSEVEAEEVAEVGIPAVVIVPPTKTTKVCSEVCFEVPAGPQGPAGPMGP